MRTPRADCGACAEPGLSHGTRPFLLTLNCWLGLLSQLRYNCCAVRFARLICLGSDACDPVVHAACVGYTCFCVDALINLEITPPLLSYRVAPNPHLDKRDAKIILVTKHCCSSETTYCCHDP